MARGGPTITVDEVGVVAERLGVMDDLPRRPRLPRPLKRLLTNPLSLTGVILVAFFAFVAIGAPYIAPPADPDDPYMIPHEGYSQEPRPPNNEHIFGTTQGQYDIFYGVVWGTRTAFQVGLSITAFSVVIGLIVGCVAGYYGGLVEEFIMRIVDIFMAFPFLLATLTLSAVLHAQRGQALILALTGLPVLNRMDFKPSSIALLTGIVALIVFSWMTYARLIRGDILSVKERDYVLAARVVGAGGRRIMLRHVIPNSIFPTLVVASMDMGSYVLAFAALSFLGLGVSRGYADWGQMISYARHWIPNLSKYWYTVFYPGMAIVLFVLGWNLIGDAFRDILDPKLVRGRR